MTSDKLRECLKTAFVKNLVEAQRSAKTYCDYWGDESGGVEKG